MKTKLFTVLLSTTLWSTQATASTIECGRSDFAQTRLTIEELTNEVVMKLSSNYTHIISGVDTPWAPSESDSWGLNTTEIEITFPKSDCVRALTNPMIIECESKKLDVIAREWHASAGTLVTEAKTPTHWLRMQLNLVTTETTKETRQDHQLALNGYTALSPSIQNSAPDWHYNCSLIP